VKEDEYYKIFDNDFSYSPDYMMSLGSIFKNIIKTEFGIHYMFTEWDKIIKKKLD